MDYRRGIIEHLSIVIKKIIPLICVCVWECWKEVFTTMPET